MSQSIYIELVLPKDWQQFRLPPALRDRLQDLLDQQDQTGKLSARERREAKALTQLVDMLALMKVRAELASKSCAS
jgi:hypothetical protein